MIPCSENNFLGANNLIRTASWLLGSFLLQSSATTVARETLFNTILELNNVCRALHDSQTIDALGGNQGDSLQAVSDFLTAINEPHFLARVQSSQVFSRSFTHVLIHEVMTFGRQFRDMGVKTDTPLFESIFHESDFSKSTPRDWTPGLITRRSALEDLRKSVGPIPGGLEVPIHGPSVSPIASPIFTRLGTPENIRQGPSSVPSPSLISHTPSQEDRPSSFAWSGSQNPSDKTSNQKNILRARKSLAKLSKK